MKLAHHDGPGFPELSHWRRVAHALGVLTDSRRQAFDIQLVFHRHRNAMHGSTPVATQHFRFGNARFCQSVVRHQVDVGVQLSVHDGDSVQHGPR